MHMLRSLPPALTDRFAERIDEKTASTLLDVLGYEERMGGPAGPGSLAYARIFLPLKQGGLGLQSLRESSRPAYVGACALVGPRVASLIPGATPAQLAQVDPAVEGALASLLEAKALKGDPALWKVERLFVPQNPKAPYLGVRGVQHHAHSTIAEERRRAVAQKLGIDTQACETFLTNADPSATAWLAASVAIPVHRMRDGDFALAAIERMGGIDPARGRPAACKVCTQTVGGKTSAQHHVRGCPGTKRFHSSRHAHVKGVILSVARHLPGAPYTVADEPPVAPLYPRSASSDAPNTEHRGDILLRHRGNPTTRYLADLVISYPDSATKGMGEGKGVQCAEMERVKRNHYNRHYTIPERDLVPLAFQPNGYAGPAATAALRTWCRTGAALHAQIAAASFPLSLTSAEKRQKTDQLARSKYLDLLFSARARIGAAIVSESVPQLRVLLQSVSVGGRSRAGGQPRQSRRSGSPLP
jgi:hypothetical protein